MSQIPVPPLQRATDGSPVYNPLWMNEAQETLDGPLEKGIPTLISWNQGGNDVLVEGSWDNWTTRYASKHNLKESLHLYFTLRNFMVASLFPDFICNQKY